jgi:hypothetical protein
MGGWPGGSALDRGCEVGGVGGFTGGLGTRERTPLPKIRAMTATTPISPTIAMTAAGSWVTWTSGMRSREYAPILSAFLGS